MSWCISIVINEISKEEALKSLDKIRGEIKTKDDIFVEGPIVDDSFGKLMGFKKFKYDSYTGIWPMEEENDTTKKFSGEEKSKA